MSFVNVEIDETECCEVATPSTEVGDGLESVCDPIREIAWELAEANHPLTVGLENTLGDLDESLGSISQSNQELTLENRRLAVKVNDLIHRLESQRNDSEDLIEFLYERATRFEADLQRLRAHNVARPQRTRPRLKTSRAGRRLNAPPALTPKRFEVAKMPISDTTTGLSPAKSLRFSTYAGAKDVKPRDFECVWSDVVEHQSNHLVTPCEPCPGKNCSHKAGSAHNFAELAPGTTRATRNVVRVHAGVFDLDHGVIDDVKGSMRLLKAEGIEAVLSSTHSHTPSTPRLRLTLSLSRPAMASEWPALWGAINARFELHADEQAKDPARLYYDPTVPEGVKPLIWVNAGVPLDVDAVLASAPKEITGLKPTRSGDEWRGMLEIIGDGRRNSTLTAVAGALMRHAPSLSPDLAFELVLALNEARCRPPLPAKTVATIADSIARKQGARS